MATWPDTEILLGLSDKTLQFYYGRAVILDHGFAITLQTRGGTELGESYSVIAIALKCYGIFAYHP